MNEAVLIDKISRRLSRKRLNHTLSVKEEAKKLADYYGCNVDDAIVAALLHDMCRDYSEDDMNIYVKKYNLDNIYLNNKSLAHAKVAAVIAKEELNIKNLDIINAVAFHTTGREMMSLLEKIIYIADVIEPNRKFDGVEDLRMLVYKDINNACLKALGLSINYVIDKNEYLHIDTLLARNYLLKNRGGKDEY